MSKQIYKQEEISEILKRAAEMQGTEGEGPSTGLTLAELEQIASDSGIDPKFVRLAATEMVFGGNTGETNFWGGPLSRTVELELDGELTAEIWERMVTEIRRSFRESGSVQEWGRAFEWTLTGNEEVNAHVTAIPRDGKTHIELHWSSPVLILPFLIPSLLISVIMLPILFGSMALGLTGIPIYIAALATVWTTARFGLGAVTKSRKNRLEKLAVTLERIAAEEMGMLSPGMTEPETALRMEAPGGIFDDEDPGREDTKSAQSGRRRARE